ncbi:MAG TPA: dipeptidase [Thermomicrobiales bacterium]|nr:dipeptidase [Thermomicrobiales bacterium]
MTASRFPVIFDGHNDTVLSLMSTGRSFTERSDQGHIDIPRAREGGLGGGFFAVFVMDAAVQVDAGDREAARTAIARYSGEVELPPMMGLDHAQPMALKAAGTLLRVARESEGTVRVVRTATELQHCLDNGIFAMLLHFEGAEPLDTDGLALEVFYAAGFRSLGLTWSRKNLYCEGVPFKFPSGPDLGPGLTDAGKELVRQCNELGVMIDLSHITEQGFWDVAAISDKPLVATHSNAHVVSQSPRNLTDKQLDAVRDSGGVVGLNYHVGFLRPDGAHDADTPISIMVDHVEHLVERVGIDGVALGSDFDGATMPNDLKDATGLPKLMAALQDRGYDNESLTKIAHANWVRVLRETWGE